MTDERRIEICDHCGDTTIVDGTCPVCSQQILYTTVGNDAAPARTFPLSLVTDSRFKMRSVRGRSAGPCGKVVTCAVVLESRREYLTACGKVLPTRVHSVWRKAPTCKVCRKALRANVANVVPEERAAQRSS